MQYFDQVSAQNSFEFTDTEIPPDMGIFIQNNTNLKYENVIIIVHVIQLNEQKTNKHSQHQQNNKLP